jgi:hypothetical protein
MNVTFYQCPDCVRIFLLHAGGTDIAAYTNVGIVNHYTFHDLRLQNGHEYYATVRGIIYLNYFFIIFQYVKLVELNRACNKKILTQSGRLTVYRQSC